MKPVFKISHMLDNIGLYVLFLLLILNSFHYALAEIQSVTYYRENIAFIFFILVILKVHTGRTDYFDKRIIIRKELFFVLLFPMLLVFFKLIDPGKSLYGEFNFQNISMSLDSVDPGFYVLRNALLYIPMVVYFSLRGLSDKEIRKISILVVSTAVASIIGYLYFYNLATLGTLTKIVELGGSGMSYNSYIPYLTFPVLSALYLLINVANKTFKTLISCALLFIFIFILLSSSRQSALFSALCGLFFLVMNKRDRFLKRILFLSLGVLIGCFAFQQFTKDQELGERFIEKYSSAEGMVKTSRLEIASEGLGLLEPYEFFTGAGLTSVIASGPHNDFIRWTQRIGIFAMLIGFLPFLLAAKKAYRSISKVREPTLTAYLFLAISYTLFHSMFGYPREDANQALYCFLGLALWLGYGKFVTLQHTLVNREV